MWALSCDTFSGLLKECDRVFSYQNDFVYIQVKGKKILKLKLRIYKVVQV